MSKEHQSIRVNVATELDKDAVFICSVPNGAKVYGHQGGFFIVQYDQIVRLKSWSECIRYIDTMKD